MRPDHICGSLSASREIYHSGVRFFHVLGGSVNDSLPMASVISPHSTHFPAIFPIRERILHLFETSWSVPGSVQLDAMGLGIGG